MHVDAPSTSLVASFTVPDDERPTLSVRRNGRTVLAPSPLGIKTLEQHYAETLSVVDHDTRSFKHRYETPAGKCRDHEYRANEARVTLQNNNDAEVQIDLQVSDTAIGYRYRLLGEGPVIVTGEASKFALPADADAWTMPWEKKHEGVFSETTAAKTDGELGYPALFEIGDDWLFCTETDVDGRYCASRLSTKEGETAFSIKFPESPHYRNGTAREEISARRPLTTPWRVVVVGDLADIVQSNVVTDLVSPERVHWSGFERDFDWVRPGRVAWSWWSDGSSPSDHECQREYVDYAAERGWEYILVDDGWEREWLPDLVEYADDQNVGVFLWARWSWLNTPEKRDLRLDQWADWGVCGVKIDFMNSDAQEMMQFYENIAQATAERGLLLNVHGSITPKGLRRQWPHLLTYEGVHGAENYHPVPKTIDPSHNVILPFTRNVLGPMDYTPVVFSAETRQTSMGHELAQSVVYESGLQHFADSIESYTACPEAEQFLEVVPAAWDETRFIDGRPADRASIARRRGDEWFLGTITAGEAQTIECPLSFLNADRTYEATLLSDDDEGESLRSETLKATVDGRITVSIAENGGFAAQFRAIE